MRAQETVAQAVERAHPHATGVDRQLRREAGQHLARSLVGEGDRQQPGRAASPRLDQPGDARGEDAGLAGARAGEDQRVLVGQGDGGELFGIEVVEEGHGAAAGEISECGESSPRIPFDRNPGAAASQSATAARGISRDFTP